MEVQDDDSNAYQWQPPRQNVSWVKKNSRWTKASFYNEGASFPFQVPEHERHKMAFLFYHLVPNDWENKDEWQLDNHSHFPIVRQQDLPVPDYKAHLIGKHIFHFQFPSNPSARKDVHQSLN
jgi:hypothetical protein